MNRLRRLKEEKIKNTLKTISCVLALALVIGSVQGLGTHALFTDTEDVTSNLAVSTGDVDVEVYTDEDSGEYEDDRLESGFQGDMIKDGSSESKTFKISNKGTLNQKLKLKLTTNSNLGEILSNITYTLELKYPNQQTEIIINNLGFDEINEIGQEFDLDYILEPGQEINCIATISARTVSNQIDGIKDIEFDLDILASQIGNENNNGFTDLYEQHNLITVGEYTGGELIAYFRGNSSIGVRIPLIGIISVGVNFESILAGEGEFKKEDLEIGKNIINIGRGVIDKVDGKIFNVGDDGIGSTFSEKQTLTAQVDGEVWKIYFRYVSGDLQAYYIVIPSTAEVEVVKPSIEEIEVLIEEVEEPTTEEMEAPSEEVMEPTIEEVEAPSEEVVEPSTEEMEDPSEEVVEPSTEEMEDPSEEVVEPSTEEMEDPSEEIVEASTEEMEAPSEIEVVLPSKEETEIEE